MALSAYYSESSKNLTYSYKLSEDSWKHLMSYNTQNSYVLPCCSGKAIAKRTSKGVQFFDHEKDSNCPHAKIDRLNLYFDYTVLSLLNEYMREINHEHKIELSTGESITANVYMVDQDYQKIAVFHTSNPRLPNPDEIKKYTELLKEQDITSYWFIERKITDYPFFGSKSLQALSQVGNVFYVSLNNQEGPTALSVYAYHFTVDPNYIPYSQEDFDRLILGLFVWGSVNKLDSEINEPTDFVLTKRESCSCGKQPLYFMTIGRGYEVANKYLITEYMPSFQQIGENEVTDPQLLVDLTNIINSQSEQLKLHVKLEADRITTRCNHCGEYGSTHKMHRLHPVKIDNPIKLHEKDIYRVIPKGVFWTSYKF
ncbi:hypothetical protein [Acinetobacter sp. P1(2025)]|uniref:hypothetical protein n=1 Tax=Acinetobacter sp. P1(2025) TaxID=3446120 RepID=UPI003F52F69C